MAARPSGPARWVALVAALVLASGCSSSDRAAEGREQPRAAGAPSPLASAPAGPTAAAGDAELALGETGVVTTATLRVTAVSTRVVSGAGGRQERRLGVALRACTRDSSPAPSAFTLQSWSVLDARGRRVAAIGDTWTDPPQSGDTPWLGELVDPGRCIAGLMVFGSTRGAAPRSVDYDNVSGESLSWTLDR